jgi:uridine kinase
VKALKAVLDAVDRCVRREPRVLVAIDGPDAAGKTTFANEVAANLSAPVFRASIDDFHRPRAHRLARGPLSPEGYYEDAFDVQAAREELLLPFRHGAPVIRDKVHDLRSDSRVDRPSVSVRDAKVLVVDGVFLLRPELRELWDIAVYLFMCRRKRASEGRWVAMLSCSARPSRCGCATTTGICQPRRCTRSVLGRLIRRTS